MSAITRCKKCNEYIEYDDSDVRMGGDFNALVTSDFGLCNYYIICPVCGAAIDLGVILV